MDYTTFNTINFTEDFCPSECLNQETDWFTQKFDQWLTQDKLDPSIFTPLDIEPPVNFDSLEYCPLTLEDLLHLTPPLTPESSGDEKTFDLPAEILEPTPQVLPTCLEADLFSNDPSESDVLMVQDDFFTNNHHSTNLTETDSIFDPNESVFSPQSSSGSDTVYTPPTKTTRSKPGRRGRPKLNGDSRVHRKRVQNKNAAQRYRSKKKNEDCDLKTNLEDLEDRNMELKEKVKDITKEISYLKGLINELQNRKMPTSPTITHLSFNI